MLTAKVEIIPDCSSISVGQLGTRKLQFDIPAQRCGHIFSMGWKYQKRPFNKDYRHQSVI